MLSGETLQAYFYPQAEHELHVDGCPMGVAATLRQRKLGDQVWEVVQYASQSLTDTEKRYSQIELEDSLVPVWNTVWDGNGLQTSGKRIQQAHTCNVYPGAEDRKQDVELRLSSRGIPVRKGKHFGLHITTPLFPYGFHSLAIF